MEEAIADMVLAELGIDNLKPASEATLLGVPELLEEEARALALSSAPNFAAAGLPEADLSSCAISHRPLAQLWGGMGGVYEIAVESPGSCNFSFVAKRVCPPSRCDSVGQQRKRDSYACEAAFYLRGHAERLARAGCAVPFPLHVDGTREDGITICMTKLQGNSVGLGEKEMRLVMSWLARLHAAYWGRRADEAVAEGLQPQGGYWYLDTRKKEHAKMPTTGWEGRLRLAARAFDDRLKMDTMQTVCHGDAKAENIMILERDDGMEVSFFDFQYCGKAPPSKDLAYVLTCASSVPQCAEALLEAYHSELCALLQKSGDPPPTMDALQASLALAYCDLGRWMSGWGWWGHPLDEKIEAVLCRLDNGSSLEAEEDYAKAVMREFPLP
mmetsp:Transcript_32405/g.65489  ORF Transcript_32405/g.65489 Transcript_32405/m.65489 type:complete len:385 (+) Transcript_32405:52-1206(+)